MANEEENLVLGVETNLSGLDKFIEALGELPAAAARIGQAINASDLGSNPDFERRGEMLAQSFTSGFEKMIGGSFDAGDLQARLVESLKLSPASLETVLQSYRVVLQEIKAMTNSAGLDSLYGLGGGSGGEGSTQIREIQTAAQGAERALADANAQATLLIEQLRRADALPTNVGERTLAGSSRSTVPPAQVAASQIERARVSPASVVTPASKGTAADIVGRLSNGDEQVLRRIINSGGQGLGFTPQEVVAAAKAQLGGLGFSGGPTAAGAGGGARPPGGTSLAGGLEDPDDEGRKALLAAAKERAANLKVAAEAAKQDAGVEATVEAQIIEQSERLAASTEKLAVNRQNAASKELAAAASREKSGLTPEEQTEQAANFRAARSQQTLDTNIRKGNLSNYLNDPDVGAIDKVFASLRGAAPGDKSIGFGNEFKAGFLGTNPDIAQQLGQTAKFSVFYGAAYAALTKLSDGLHEVTKAALDYETSLVSLERVTGDNRGGAENLANAYSQAAVSAGLAPNAGVAVGAQAIGLYGLSGASAANQQAIGNLSVTTAGQLAATTGQTPEAILNNIAGIIRSFNLTPYDQSSVQDQLTSVARKSGVDLGGLINATADIGTLGSSAGFDAADIAAMVARIASTTGQAPTSAASSLKQVLSKANDPTTTAALAAAGVNTNGTTLAQQLAQVGKLGLSTAQQNALTLQFGRGASQQALNIILNAAPQINQTAATARSATGAGQRDFDTYFNSVVGQIRQLGVELKKLAQDLAETGFLDAFALLIKALNLTVGAIDDVVSAFNLIPRPLRTVSAVLLELYAAALLYSKTNLTGSSAAGGLVDLLGGRGSAGRAGAARGLAQRIPGLRGFVGAAEGSVEGEAAGSAAAAGAVNAGRSALAKAPVIGSRFAGAAEGAAAGAVEGEAAAGAAGAAEAGGLALGPIGAAVIALGVSINTAKNLIDAGNQTKTDLGAANAAAGNAFTAQQLSNAASVQGQVVRDTLNQQRATFSNLGLGVLNKLPGSNAAQQQELARQNQAYLQDEAKIIAAAIAARTASNPASTFGNFDSLDSVTQALQTLSQEGNSAADNVNSLNVAFAKLNQVAGSSSTTGALAFLQQGQGTEFSEAASAAAVAARNTTVAELNKQSQVFVASRSGAVPTPGAAAAAAASKTLGNVPLAAFNAIGEASLTALVARGKNPATGDVTLDSGDIAAIRAAATSQAETSIKGFSKLSAAAQKTLIDAFVTNLEKNLKGGSFLNPQQEVSGADIANYLSSVTSQIPTAAASLVTETGNKTAGSNYSVSQLQAALKNANAALGSAGDATDRKVALQAITAAQDQLDTALDARAADLLASGEEAATAAGNKLNLNDKVGKDALQLQAMEAGLKNYRKGTDDYKALSDQIAQARQSLAAEAAVQADAILDDNRTLGTNPGNQLATARNAVKTAQEALARARVSGSPQDIADARVGVQQAQYNAQQAQISQDQARRLAGVSPDDAVGQARAQLNNAKEALNATQKGDEQYYQALAAYKQAQLAYSNAVQTDAANARKLSIDLTDPVANAEEQLKEAVAALNSAKSAAQKRADAVTVAQDQTAVSQAKFTQGISDIQTAHDLQRISDQQYIAYLDAQQQSLQHQIAGMKTTSNGYRQAVDDLNQVDQLIQAASAQAVSQFNIGNIDLPTVYQVRRAVQAGLPTSQGQYGSSTINIDGADTSAIIQWLASQLGPTSTVVRTTGTGRKV